jgi:hypothetical protein
MSQVDLREASRRQMPELPALDGLYASAALTWRGRMINEHTSARVFEGLASQLRAAGFDEARVAECAGFADEERRHGVLCGAVVEALGGQAIFEAQPSEEFPRHRAVDPREAIVRNLLSISCMSETIAVSLISAERLEMPSGDLRDLLETILADEIGHARFGWKIVSEEVVRMDAATRRRLDAYLVVALAHLEAHELAHINAKACPPAEGAALGLCNGSDARGLFYDTVTEVILPRLDDLGLRASEAWARRAA